MKKPRRRIASNVLGWINWFTPAAFFIMACNHTQRKLGYMDFVDVVALRSRLDRFDVIAISQAMTWDPIPFGKVISFLAGCGVNPSIWSERQRVEKFWRNGKWSSARRSPDWESVFKPLAAETIRVMKARPKP
jgi:hypothetical protein